jgi:hypothetical protein
MMYNDHDRSRFQIPAEPLVLANNTRSAQGSADPNQSPIGGTRADLLSFWRTWFFGQHRLRAT